MITFKDVSGQRVLVVGNYVVMIPSLAIPGDGKCKVIANPIIFEVDRPEAERLLQEHKVIA